MCIPLVCCTSSSTEACRVTTPIAIVQGRDIRDLKPITAATSRNVTLRLDSLWLPTHHILALSEQTDLSGVLCVERSVRRHEDCIEEAVVLYTEVLVGHVMSLCKEALDDS
jgi:hypothetical protein